MKKTLYACTMCAALVSAGAAWATPSTTIWAPSTTNVQPYLIPHITYDTYFWQSIPEKQPTSPISPVATGLTMGVLPWDKLQLELGFDVLLPTTDPILFNAKLGTPEDTLFPGSPSLAGGIYGVGTHASSATTPGTDFNVLYAQVQKNLPWGGFVSVGGYYGAGSTILFLSSDGSENRLGFIGGIGSPDLNLNLPGLKKITFTGDVQTGKNSQGAAAAAINVFFSDTVSILTGPVYFFDRFLQPGQRNFLWTVQLDIDVTLFAPAPAPTPAPPPKA